jgi:hypothetical protein
MILRKSSKRSQRTPGLIVRCAVLSSLLAVLELYWHFTGTKVQTLTRADCQSFVKKPGKYQLVEVEDEADTSDPGSSGRYV